MISPLNVPYGRFTQEGQSGWVILRLQGKMDYLWDKARMCNFFSGEECWSKWPHVMAVLVSLEMQFPKLLISQAILPSLWSRAVQTLQGQDSRGRNSGWPLCLNLTLVIYHSLYNIYKHMEKNNPKIYMEPQNTPNNQSNLEQEEQSWRHYISLYQATFQSYSNQNSIILV